MVQWGQRFVGGGRRQGRNLGIDLGFERVVTRLNGAIPEEISETIEGWDLDQLAKLFAGKGMQNPTSQKLVQALQGERIKDPTEDDPLGTDPRNPMMPIGRAIATAAAQRSRDYELDGLLNMPEQPSR